jgi:uncharacterized protein (TIGR02646 family)
MKHIVKGDEPPELNEWKSRVHDPENVGWRPTWENFQDPQKAIVHNALMTDQGYICCYCMSTIKKKSSHIEHVNPRSNTSEDEKLSYGNMLASCDGEHRPTNGISGNDVALLQQHCGHYRKSWHDPSLYVSPLSQECENRFRYYDDGAIRPVDGDSGAEETIKRMSLDCSLLEKNRKAAIVDATRDLATLTDAQIVERYREFSKRDSNGKFKKYCIAVQQVLSRLVSLELFNQRNEK